MCAVRLWGCACISSAWLFWRAALLAHSNASFPDPQFFVLYKRAGLRVLINRLGDLVRNARGGSSSPWVPCQRGPASLRLFLLAPGTATSVTSNPSWHVLPVSS